jgi:hypothetical protein
MTYEKELLVFQPITSATIEAHEVYHYTIMRKTLLGVMIHNVRALKHICIQDYKAFKIKHFLQALKLQ